MITVYIADDEVWIILGLKKLIQKSGLPFQVIGDSMDGLIAREDILRLKPDVVFTDIRMPSLSGLELLKSIHDARLATKTVIISGYAEFEYARTCVYYRAFEYLLKPIEPEELREVLKRLQETIAPDSAMQVCPVEKAPDLSEKKIEKILSEIREHYTDNISLAVLAKKYSISQGHLSVMIKNELGLSFSEYVTSRRMEKARELLGDETMSISEIAEAVGYHDYYYFTKVFKKTQGISPSKYRKAL